ncbi:thymidylate synthase [Nitrospirillum viridazoti]|uniref:Thymidylate synthase n=1 Tax=Nitrospirillum viridazoti CBAmc TaxID=1441467 RepID=A0A248JM13_9PROT|nr:thymidylate synthase [Nitrospirillum amazonense]ASG19510.1 thymidylate synthase [Nitrospirillum amazonense CBAmc]TWB26729.1 thymidylate synthase [Nitrospirillum amazonense]
MHIRRKTFDDLLRVVFSRILRHGLQVEPIPSKGANKELFGVVLELTQPRARVSRTENRGRIFSALGELFWYLSGSNSLKFIEYYISKGYEAEEGTDIVWGGYGPRLLNKSNVNQIHEVVGLLKRNVSSRRAVIQLYDSGDLAGFYKDVPCTCTMQFIVRRGFLHMYVSMRSNDAYKGLPHDVFAFTMIQELIARELGVRLGRYKHAVASLHLYDTDLKKAEAFMAEDWQTKRMMPPMPMGSQWPSFKLALDAEEKIRNGYSVDVDKINVNDYWKDIIRLLQIYNVTRGTINRDNLRRIVFLRKSMKSSFYDQYIRKKSDKFYQDQLDLNLESDEYDEGER